MREAAQAATDDAPPPLPLEIGWQCERWHCLPDAGGLLDQDAQLMREIAACMNVYGTITRVRSLRGKQIHQLTERERRLIKYLRDEGLYG